MKTRSEKAAINIVVLVIYDLISIGCNLILPRLILQEFGSEYNGIVSSITQFLNFILILRMGISGPTRVVLYKALAQNDDAKVSGIIKATEQYMRKVGIIIILYIAFLAIAYPFVSITNISHYEIAILVLIIGAGSFAEFFWGITYNILLTADQTQYIYYIIQSFSTIASTIAAYILIKSGASIFEVKSFSSFFFVITPILLSVIVRRYYKLDRKAKPDKIGLNGRWDAMGHSIANIIHSFTDITILTIFTDIKVVSVYTIYNLAFNAIKKLMTIFTTGLEAGFGNMIAKNEISGANKIFDIFEFVMYAFCSVVYSSTLVLILPFVGLYTKGVTDINYIVPTFAILATFAQLFMSIREPYLTIVQAAGHYKQTRNGAFTEAGINVVTSVVLTHTFGLVGVTIGTLAANVFRTTQYILYLQKNVLNRDVTKALKLIIWLIFNIGTIYLTCNLIAQMLMIDNWIKWIALGGICFFVSLSITMLSAFVFFRPILFNTINYFLKLVRRKG